MLNSVILIGKIINKPTISETSTGKKVANIQLKVTRNFTNTYGKKESDIINCTLWSVLAENALELYQKDNLVAIKGRLQSRDYTIENKTIIAHEVIAERITYL